MQEHVKMVWGRNVDNAIIDTLRQIVAILDVAKTAQRRWSHLDYVSDGEANILNPNPKLKEDQDEARLLRVLSRANANLAIEVTPYDGKLDINVVLDWIFDIEKFFDYENILDNRKVKIAFTKLKGHASLWWEHLQIDRQRRERKR